LISLLDKIIKGTETQSRFLSSLKKFLKNLWISFLDSSDKTSRRKTTWCLLSLFHQLPSFKLTCEAAQSFYWEGEKLEASGNPRGNVRLNQTQLPLRTITYNAFFRVNDPAEGFCFERGPLFGKRFFFVVAHTDLVIWVVLHFS